MRATGKQSRLKKPTAKRLRILFTCVGRRVQLLTAFRQAADRLGVNLDVHGADATRFSPAMHLVDKAHTVAPIAEGRYVEELLAIARRSETDLVVPLIDSELPLIAAAADRFAAIRCRALISSPSVVRICRDKLATYDCLQKAGIDTPRTWPWVAVTTLKRHHFPYYLKPRTGSAAVGNYVVRTVNELETFGRRVPDAIVQEFVDGSEHTLDVYCGLDGRPRCVVPRKRIEVRTGEVSKGVITKDAALMAVGRNVAEVLGECRGVITVQCIVEAGGRIRVIEINPRFGGGAPLSIRAGADFPGWIMTELLGKTPRINPTGFRDDLAMLRYDEAVFVANASKLLNTSRPPRRPTVSASS